MNAASMITDVDQFLSSLKRFNDAGVINMLGVIATFTVALNCACSVDSEVVETAKACDPA